jgi:hypothetical protein
MPVGTAFQELVDTLDRLAIPYMVGGSLVSSVHGIFRSTNDIDIVAALRDVHVEPLASELMIHFSSGYKFDISPAAGNPYFELQLTRCKEQQVALGVGASIGCSVATAEDTVLAKLAWYRAGGEQSDRQWNDVRGIRSVQGALLDRTYMKEWARYLKVDDLLDRLLSEEESA